MSRKLDLKKSRKAEPTLSPEQLGELEMIVDRLSVQNPKALPSIIISNPW